nr:hypothetical protein [uncultured Lacibacter sp.]
MKKILCVLLGSMLLLSVYAQNKSAYSMKYDKQLRFQPFALLDPFESSIKFGMDKMVRPRMAVGADAAVYLTAEGFSKWAPGFAVSPLVRWYTDEKLKGFFETVLTYKHTERKETGWLGMDCVDGVSAYEKYDTYKRRKDVLDLSFRLGYRDRLFKSDKWCIEMFAGLGLRYKMLSIKYAEPNVCLDIEESGIDAIGYLGSTIPVNYFFVSVPAGIRFTRRL